MRWLIAAAIAASAMFAPAANAQDKYPSRVVKIIVGFPPGSSADILGRIYAQQFTEYFNQQFIVENKPGAASNIATDAVSRSTPDGYTIVIGSTANTISMNALELSYDFAKDLSPIAAFASGPIILMVNSKLGVSNVKDFVKYAKDNSGKVTFGSSGTWSGPHMAGEQFNAATGADLQFIPFQGVPAAITALLGGQIQSVFATAPTAAGFAKDDRVKLLAVASDTRSSLLPEVRTLREEGLEGADTSIWYGFFAPKGTPLEIRQKLAEAIGKITQRPDVKAALQRVGCEPLSIQLDALGSYVVKDIENWKGVTEQVKAKMKR